MTDYRAGTTAQTAASYQPTQGISTSASTQIGDLVLVWVSPLCIASWDFAAKGCPVITSTNGDIYQQVGGTSAYSSNSNTGGWISQTAPYWTIASKAGADSLSVTLTASWGGTGSYYDYETASYSGGFTGVDSYVTYAASGSSNTSTVTSGSTTTSTPGVLEVNHILQYTGGGAPTEVIPSGDTTRAGSSQTGT